MAREEDIGVLRRELLAICEWDKMLSYCLSGDTRKLYSEEVQSYKARVLRRRRATAWCRRVAPARAKCLPPQSDRPQPWRRDRPSGFASSRS